MRRWTAIAATVLVAAFAGATAGIAGWEALDDDGGATTTATTTAQLAAARPTATGSGDELSVADIYRRAGDSVVEVRASSGGGGATGSGFVIDDEGHVVTNHHVIEGASTVSVVTADGDEHSATVVGSDSSTDIALLDVVDGADVYPLELGCAESLAVGDPVVAIGSPFGLQGTVTSGIVSGLDREIQAPDGFAIDGAIQTDAALNSGNSGGPLLDARGRVIGVNSQIQTTTGGNDGIGYAVSVDTMKRVVSQLLENGTAQHGYLGVQLGDTGGEDGVPVASVVDGGPADTGGLEAGDRILSVGGESVDSVSDVRQAVGNGSPGEEVELEVERGGERTTVTVTLGERPAQAG